jgi:hypothetical protein
MEPDDREINRLDWGGRMELDDRALPLTRGQLDIWLAQEFARSSSGSDPEEGYWRAAVLHSSFGWGELAVPGSW